MIYTGIGSRKAIKEAPDILEWMCTFAALMAEAGHVLRSGGAPGPDQAFGSGASSVDPELVEVFLPSLSFGAHQTGNYLHYPPSETAMKTVDVYHPNPSALNPFTRLLMARNAHQVLGTKITTGPKSDFVVMWAPDVDKYTETEWSEDGSVLDCPGGTGQAVRIAAAHGITVYHAGQEGHRDYLMPFAFKKSVTPRVWSMADKSAPKDAIYIGRPKGGGYEHYGNPFTHRRGTKAEVIVTNREKAVARYETWLMGTTDKELLPNQRQYILDHLPALKGKDLICWCAPQACHGDVLILMANDASHL